MKRFSWKLVTLFCGALSFSSCGSNPLQSSLPSAEGTDGLAQRLYRDDVKTLHVVLGDPALANLGELVNNPGKIQRERVILMGDSKFRYSEPDKEVLIHEISNNHTNNYTYRVIDEMTPRKSLFKTSYAGTYDIKVYDGEWRRSVEIL